MKVGGKRVMVCSCEGTMKLDAKALASALGTEPSPIFHHLCRSQLAAYNEALASGEPLLVACRQEQPLFTELAEEAGVEAPICADIRDRAGWSEQGAEATAKMAALIAEAALELEPTPVVTLASAGRVLVLGNDEAALEAARRLSGERAVQLLLSGSGEGLAPPSPRGFTLWRGKAVRAVGALGNWTITVEGLQGLSASSRARMVFDTARDGLLNSDVVLDLTGEAPLVRRRDGWVAADPRVPVQVEKAISEAHGLMGEFEKPRYIRIDTALCAHSRNGKVACTRCVDACPSSAIQGKGDWAVVDAHACGGHGACASACPTGAIRYDFPAANGMFKRLTTMLATYAAAGGRAPVLLIHDAEHGEAVIGALARFGAGLPAHVLPFAVNAAAAMGLDMLLTALAHGAAQVMLLADPARQVDLEPMRAAADLANRISGALGYGERVGHMVSADPAELATLLSDPVPAPIREAAEFLVLGAKRQTLSLALSHLRRHASTPVDILPLETGDPFGALVLDQDKCTLCLACVGVCPANALSGHPDKPSLGLLETNCVQCGLCKVTCPEKAITLAPRINFSETARNRLVLKEEEAFACVRCGTPFGTRSSIERLVERLAGHSMFAGTNRIELIKMCESCRVVAQYDQEEGDRAMAAGTRPVTRTTDDYLKEKG